MTLLVVLLVLFLATSGGAVYGPEHGPVAWSPLGLVLVVIVLLVVFGHVHLP